MFKIWKLFTNFCQHTKFDQLGPSNPTTHYSTQIKIPSIYNFLRSLCAKPAPSSAASSPCNSYTPWMAIYKLRGTATTSSKTNGWANQQWPKGGRVPRLLLLVKRNNPEQQLQPHLPSQFFFFQNYSLNRQIGELPPVQAAFQFLIGFFDF